MKIGHPLSHLPSLQKFWGTPLEPLAGSCLLWEVLWVHKSACTTAVWGIAEGWRPGRERTVITLSPYACPHCFSFSLLIIKEEPYICLCQSPVSLLPWVIWGKWLKEGWGEYFGSQSIMDGKAWPQELEVVVTLRPQLGSRERQKLVLSCSFSFSLGSSPWDAAAHTSTDLPPQLTQSRNGVTDVPRHFFLWWFQSLSN